MTGTGIHVESPSRAMSQTKSSSVGGVLRLGRMGRDDSPRAPEVMTMTKRRKGQKLIHVNPYLRDPARRRAMFVQTVISSSKVEGVRLTVKDLADPKGEINA